tara:strand:+ start:165 stop:830 length:666 start_codon:yes stop_codon:yes gene_type:complete
MWFAKCVPCWVSGLALPPKPSHRLNHRRTGHNQYFETRANIEVVVTEHVDDYRAAVSSLVRPDDVALEVGCAGGVTTAALGKACCVAVGVDKSFSPGMLAEQSGYAKDHVTFKQLDATDIGALLQLSKSAAQEARERYDPASSGDGAAAGPAGGFSVILVDISGSAKLSAVLDLLERYEFCFKDSLRLLIVKSFRYACVLDRTRTFESSRAATAEEVEAEA